MAKYVCTVCGYVYEGDAAPEICPVKLQLRSSNYRKVKKYGLLSTL
jgi:rubredoxin